MKKKLEDAYIPDKQSRKEKVVLGLFGLDSLVTAYLLKIQKYEVIAVTAVNSWEDFTGDLSTTLSCFQSPAHLDHLKEFCHRLNIPLQIVKIPNEFRENVIGPWMGDKIQGKKPLPCLSCHDLRIRTVYEKMKEIGAEHIATGHYAKIFHHESHQLVYVHTSTDEINDQSALLSRLPHEMLSKLILPLSDLTRKEVLKLAENFGISEEKRALKIHECLRLTPDVEAFLEKKVPARFLKEGEFTSVDGTQSYGPHSGVHHYTNGGALEIKDGSRVPKIFADYSYKDQKIIVAGPDYFLRKKLMLIKCHFSEEVSWLEPFSGLVVLRDNTYAECWVFPKNLNAVSIELNEKHNIFPGDVVSVVKKKGRNAKLFLTGEIQMVTEENDVSEGEQNVPNPDPFIDF